MVTGWWIANPPGAAFTRDRAGSVTMLWALMGLVLIGLIGLTLDFTRAQAIRTQLQNAVDGAALVAGRAANASPAERTAAARAVFDAEMGDLAAATTFLLTPTADAGHRAEASYPMPMSLARLIRDEPWTIRVSSQAEQGGRNLEVAMILDTTGSMQGARIADLRAAAADMVDIVVHEDQSPYYSKVALIPYSMAVNAGAYADSVRGEVIGPRSISAADWAAGAGVAMTGATRASPLVVTANDHGFSNDDPVHVSGVNGMTQLNNRVYTIANRTTNTFQLRNASGAIVSSSGYGRYTSGGTVMKCQATRCHIVVTASGHGLENDDYVYITGVNGMTQINTLGHASWQVADVTDDTFALVGSNGPSYSAYVSGGAAHCLEAGCDYFRFTNSGSSAATRIFAVSTCVTERGGVNAFTDAAPNAAPLGRNYASAGNSCPSGNAIVPLSSDRAMLTGRVNALQASGSTGGHIGVGWGWYMLSPNFGYLWPGASQPGEYRDEDVLKVAVLMTDGGYNSSYCNGVISSDSTSGSGAASDHINCSAPNGHAFNQAQSLCAAMRQAGVVIYTVGFDIADDQRAQDLVNQCATDSRRVFMAGTGQELREAFRTIGNSIAQLRLTR